MIQLGDALAGLLGAFAFLGTFIADLGDILGMIMGVILALIGAGVLSSITGRLGQWIAKDLPPKTGRIISLPLAALAGATLTILIGAGIDWLYQINDPMKILWLPAIIGALIGLALAIKFSAQDTLPTGLVIYYLARTIFNALRSIEALIMVIVFVVWVGIGPFAGVLALSLHTIAALAKLYSNKLKASCLGRLRQFEPRGLLDCKPSSMLSSHRSSRRIFLLQCIVGTSTYVCLPLSVSLAVVVSVSCSCRILTC